MSRVAFSCLISMFVHVGALGALIWLGSQLPRWTTDEGHVITLAFEGDSEPQPAGSTPTFSPLFEPDPLEPKTREVPRVETVVDRVETDSLVVVSAEGEVPPPQLSPPPARSFHSSTATSETLPTRRAFGEAGLLAAAPSQARSGAQVDELPRKLASNPKPPYPADARAAGHVGRVVLLVEINAAGRVDDVQLQTTSGTRSLDESALRTVRTWRFEPARRAGVAVPYAVSLGVNFGFSD